MKIDANKALHWMPIQLCSIATSELGRWLLTEKEVDLGRILID